MMVVLISQCAKKALPRTRRVLDAFADRIGDNTWQTAITQDGLLAIKKLLRKTASKNTAVSCHWIRSRTRTELLWVVGAKHKFNFSGVVPVNTTKIDKAYRDDLDDWFYLPVIQALTAIAALLHDWGKATIRFQQKLEPMYRGPQGDALRHEWVSCLLLTALIETTDSSSDDGWLNILANGAIDENQLQHVDFKTMNKPLSGLPFIAQMIAWLIVTHHRMPLPRTSAKELANQWDNKEANSIDELLSHVTREWGYWNEPAQHTLNDCLCFGQGLLINSKPWLKELKRWAKKLLSHHALIKNLLDSSSFRPILHHARLCLMLGDHYYSSLSLSDSGPWTYTSSLIANTQKDGSPKQALDQHLVGVYEQAKRNVRKLPQLEQALPITDNTAALKKKSPESFSWQDKAAKTICQWTAAHQEKKHGFFAVNMASTGSGKTFANAKIMLALSEHNDSLRYTLALGLRTLTLQTGDEYKKRIFQHSDGSDLAVLIGSKAIVELHHKSQKPQEQQEHIDHGSESQESLMEANDEVVYDGDIPEDGMATILSDKKSRTFLYAPILVCTIDHIMAATETIRGGRYILPCLRLLSSDLVIDEIDDFTGADSIAIGRLIHLAGMLGRKVMISSATIPPSLAEGYFNCYQEGWQLFAKTRNASAAIGCAWIDEFNTSLIDTQEIVSDKINQEYSKAHQQFIKKRVQQLTKQQPRRKADIIDCQDAFHSKTTDNSSKQEAYFNLIFLAALKKHTLHHQTDLTTKLKVSFGVIRTANISPCVALARYLLGCTCPEDTIVRVMPYHSQQVLLLRHEQEKHLDEVLKHKEQPGQIADAFKNTIIRAHLDNIAISDKKILNVVFILVATPVEEVGRDHDFDWAIVEPSSYRSIIQIAGRVRRHRDGEPLTPNIGVLQYNWNALKAGAKPGGCYFTRPGYELNEEILHNGVKHKAQCIVHDLRQLINEESIAHRLDAIPRISDKPPTEFRLANLEHAVTAHWLKQFDQKSPKTLQGYLTQHWYLTSLPQVLNRFRNQEPTIQLYRYPEGNNELFFIQKNEEGHVIRDAVYHEIINMTITAEYHVRSLELTEKQQERLWLIRDYTSLVASHQEQSTVSKLTIALRYGELLLRKPAESEYGQQYLYNDQLGLFKEQGGTNV